MDALTLREFLTLESEDGYGDGYGSGYGYGNGDGDGYGNGGDVIRALAGRYGVTL